MGKSPGKWIKTVLLGKKSSKSNISRGREKTTNQKEVLVSATAPEADLALDLPVASHAAYSAIDRNAGKVELENWKVTDLSLDRGVSETEDAVPQGYTDTTEDAPHDPEKIRQEQAATMAQAVFRGYQARQAFRALRGIIMLQALVRGHLVRRQAVATLSCMLGIVKVQSLVRGRRIRHSDFRLEAVKKGSSEKPLEIKSMGFVGVSISARMAKLSANSFICKLLASSPAVMPILLRYNPEDANSVSNWLQRWSASHFWKPIPQPGKVSDPKSQRRQSNDQAIETEAGKSKRNVRRVSAVNVDNVSVQTTSELEKPKRSFRKVSSHQTEPVQENPQIELEKVKRNLRKVHNPVVENPVLSEVETKKPKQNMRKVQNLVVENFVLSETESEKPKQNVEKASNASDHDDLEQMINDTCEKEETKLTVSKVPAVEANTAPLPVPAIETPDLSCADQTVSTIKDESIHVTNGDVSTKEDLTNNNEQKPSRKSFVSVKQEHPENGLQSSPVVPSYMAATESAKAKLRAQGSPKLSQEGAEKNSRRHSLSSSGTKVNSQSPRTQRLVQACGKGGNKSEKAMLSSRDGSAKGSQPDWRR